MQLTSNAKMPVCKSVALNQMLQTACKFDLKGGGGERGVEFGGLSEGG